MIRLITNDIEMLEILKEIFDLFEQHIDPDMSASIANWNQIIQKYKREAGNPEIEPKKPLHAEVNSIWSWRDDQGQFIGYGPLDEAIENAFLDGAAKFSLVASSTRNKEGANYEINFSR